MKWERVPMNLQIWKFRTDFDPTLYTRARARAKVFEKYVSFLQKGEIN